MSETRVRRAVEEPGDERILIRQDIVMRTIRVFRGRPGSPIALVQIVVTNHIFEILHEHPVETPPGSIRGVLDRKLLPRRCYSRSRLP